MRTFGTASPVLLESNAGVVWIEDSELVPNNHADATIVANACADVVLARVRVEARTDESGNPIVNPKALATSLGTRVHAYDSTLLGAAGFVYTLDGFSYTTVHGSAAIQCYSSTDRLLLSGCTVRGGSGGATIDGCPRGGDGVRSGTAEARVLDSVVQGGSSTCGSAAPTWARTWTSCPGRAWS